MIGQLSMFDVPEALPFQPRSETSREAADAAAPQAVTHRRMVLDLLRRKSAGLTDEEIQAALGIKPPAGALLFFQLTYLNGPAVVSAGNIRAIAVL